MNTFMLGRKKPQKIELLLAAVEEENLSSAMKLLLDGADPNQPTTEGDYVINKAVTSDSEVLVKLLLKNGASPNVSDEQGFAPLHVAALMRRPAILQLLIDSGADTEQKVRSQDPQFNGRTPLMSACGGIQEGFLERIEVLLATGAKVNNRDDRGWTPMMHLVLSYPLRISTMATTWDPEPEASAHPDNLFDLLVEGRRDETVLPRFDFDPFQAFVSAMENGDDPMPTAAADNCRAIDLLVENGADINARNNAGFTAIMIAEKEGFNAVRDYLCQLGAELHENDREILATQDAREEPEFEPDGDGQTSWDLEGESILEVGMDPFPPIAGQEAQLAVRHTLGYSREELGLSGHPDIPIGPVPAISYRIVLNGEQNAWKEVPLRGTEDEEGWRYFNTVIEIPNSAFELQFRVSMLGEDAVELDGWTIKVK